MTTLTPPPERDVPPAVRDRVLEQLTAPPRRRWLPLVAAATAAVAVAVPVTVLAGSGAPPPAGPVATPSLPPWTPPLGPFPGALPDGPALVRRCLNAVPAAHRPATGGVRVRAVQTDARGYVAWVGGGGFSTTCSFTWDGRPDLAGGFVDGQPEPTWAPEFDVGIAVLGTGGADTKLVSGVVSRGVRRAELRWGTARAAVAVRGPYFVGRITRPAGGSATPPTVVAYRPDGTPYHPVLLPGRDEPQPSGGPELGDGLPAAAALLRRCLWDANWNGARSRGVTLRAVFADERGYVAYVGARGKESVCAYRFGGTLDLSIGTIEGADDVVRNGYADPSRIRHGVDAMDGRSSLLPGTNSAQFIFFGNVVKGVTRVTVSVNGGASVRAAVHGPYYVARVIVPAADGRLPRMEAVLDAYDAGGDRVGRTLVSG